MGCETSTPQVPQVFLHLGEPDTLHTSHTSLADMSRMDANPTSTCIHPRARYWSVFPELCIGHTHSRVVPAISPNSATRLSQVRPAVLRPRAKARREKRRLLPYQASRSRANRSARRSARRLPSAPPLLGFLFSSLNCLSVLHAERAGSSIARQVSWCLGDTMFSYAKRLERGPLRAPTRVPGSPGQIPAEYLPPLLHSPRPILSKSSVPQSPQSPPKLSPVFWTLVG